MRLTEAVSRNSTYLQKLIKNVKILPNQHNKSLYKMFDKPVQKLDTSVPNLSTYSCFGDHWKIPNFKAICQTNKEIVKSGEMFFSLNNGIVIFTMSLDPILDGLWEQNVTLKIRVSMEFRGTPVNKDIKVDFFVVREDDYIDMNSTVNIRQDVNEYYLDCYYSCNMQNLAVDYSLTPYDTLTIVPRFSISTSQLTANVVQVPIKKTAYVDTNPINDLERLLASDEYADFVFSVGGVDFKVHKAIIAVRSSVFAAMIQHDMREKSENRAEITDVNPTVFKEMLRYVYTGKVGNLSHVVQELIRVADKYDLRGLKDICEDKLAEELCPSNAAEFLQHADMLSCERLKAQTIEYIIQNFAQVKDTDAWKDLTSSPPAKLVSEICISLSKRIPSVQVQTSTKRKTTDDGLSSTSSSSVRSAYDSDDSF